MTILLTGFEPNDNGLNASKILVQSLATDFPKSINRFSNLVHYEIMPPDTNKLGSALVHIINLYKPRFCIFVGQAPGRNKITIERIATNLKDFRTSDGAGNLPRGILIEKDSPVAYWSTLPVFKSSIKKLNDAGIPAVISNYAGNHLCNQILYQGLHYAASNKLNLKCGFIHIPPLPIQAQAQWTETPFMSLDMTRKALEIILLDLIENKT